MKNKRTLTSIVLLIAMLFMAAAPAMATDNTDTGYTLTINSATNGHAYNAYQIFSGTVDDDVEMLGDLAWGKGVNNSDLLTALKDLEAYKDCEDAAGVADVLAKMTNDSTDLDQFIAIVSRNLASATATVTAANGTAAFTALPAGYYLVLDGSDEEGSAKVMLQLVGDATVTAKTAEFPTVTKTAEDTDGTYKESISATVGKTVNFKVTGTLPANLDQYATYYYSFVDTMSEGLDYTKDSVKVMQGEIDVTDSFKIVYDDPTHTLTVTCSDVKDLENVTASTEFVLTYSATLNAKALEKGADELESGQEKNSVTVVYSNDPTQEGDGTDGVGETPADEVTVYTYNFDLVKTDGDSNILTGAEFKLYDAKTGGNEIAVVQENDGSYRVAVDGETDVAITAGNVTIKGLENGTYYLEETKAPEGYNQLTERQEVKINGENLVATTADNTYTNGGVQVVNQSGTTLPSTGGIGTTIFYTVGAVLVLGAGVLLVTKRRMGEE